LRKFAKNIAHNVPAAIRRIYRHVETFELIPNQSNNRYILPKTLKQINSTASLGEVPSFIIYYLFDKIFKSK
jgi:hypothetical protein